MTPTADARVDAYIQRAAEFAQPILVEVRSRVHQACPQVVETIKWGFPHFTHNGKIVCSMAAFKAHCAVGFWQRDVLKIAGSDRTAMGDFGRVTRLQDLPTKRAFAALIKTAVKNIDDGTDKPVAKKAVVRRDPDSIAAPDDLLSAIKRNRAAQKNWDGFSYSHRKEYVEWITKAKRPETRARRISEAVTMMEAGQSKNGKYERC